MKATSLFSRSNAVVLGAALVLALGGAVATARVERPANPVPTFKQADPNQPQEQHTYAPVVKQVLPTVVNISSSRVVRTPGLQFPMDPFFRQFFGNDFPQRAPRAEREHSLGSGVIVSPEGYILTNNHVVDSATDIRVTLPDKREFKARVVGGDKRTDIAVLKIDASDLPVITFGNSDRAQIGDTVLAIGNPFGVGETVTSGIVSATGRTGLGIEDYEDFIQTDAPINPGNSGGALITDRGDLIGINTAIVSNAGGNAGVGFAIPSNLARSVMTQLIEHGKVERAYLGIVPQDVTPAMAKAFGEKQTSGALVGDVEANSPAARAGVQRGDIIVSLNGKPVQDSNQLRMSVSMMQPGSTANLKVLRSGAEKTLSVQLAPFPAENQRASNERGHSEGALEGIEVQNLDAQTRQELKAPAGTTGVVVTRIDPTSPAADSGLRPGDVIQEVDRQPVKNVRDFDSAARKAGQNPLLLVERGGTTFYVTV